MSGLYLKSESTPGAALDVDDRICIPSFWLDSEEVHTHLAGYIATANLHRFLSRPKRGRGGRFVRLVKSIIIEWGPSA